MNMASMVIQKVEEKTAPPVIPKDVLEYLEKTFPNKVPSIDAQKRRVWAAVGQQEVINHLRYLFSKQNKPLQE